MYSSMISQLLPVEHFTDELPSAASAGSAGMAAASAGGDRRRGQAALDAPAARLVGGIHRRLVLADTTADLSGRAGCGRCRGRRIAA
jgi:hypothetical protein